MRTHLVLAIQSGRLPFPLRVFRGLRDIEVSLGFSHPSRIMGLRTDLPGFCATTVFPSVAAGEFTARHGVLLDLELPVGMPALWVAGVGDRALEVRASYCSEPRRRSMYIVMFSRSMQLCSKEEWCSMSRFDDDLHGISDSPEWRPYSSAQLIGKLGIRDQGRTEQRAAIAEWLADNKPTPKLLASLQADRLIGLPHHSAA